MAKLKVWHIPVGIIAIGALAIGASYVSGAVSVATAPSRVAQKTLNTDNIIHNYEWFRQQAYDVDAIDIKITQNQNSLTALETALGARSTWSFDDRQEHSRLTSIVNGLVAQRADMVAEYNARSKMANRSIFKTNDLPETLD